MLKFDGFWCFLSYFSLRNFVKYFFLNSLCVFDNCFWHERESDKYFRPHGIPTILIYTSRISSLHVMVFKKTKIWDFLTSQKKTFSLDWSSEIVRMKCLLKFFNIQEQSQYTWEDLWNFVETKDFEREGGENWFYGEGWKSLVIMAHRKKKKKFWPPQNSIQILPPLKIFLGNLRWNPVITFAICRQSRRLNNPWI